MSLPIILPTGAVAVYGRGENLNATGYNPIGLTMPSNFLFGTVYHIWSGGTAYMATNDVIMFDEKNIIDRIVRTSDGHVFTIVPARLATKQYVAP